MPRGSRAASMSSNPATTAKPTLGFTPDYTPTRTTTIEDDDDKSEMLNALRASRTQSTGGQGNPARRASLKIVSSYPPPPPPPPMEDFDENDDQETAVPMAAIAKIQPPRSPQVAPSKPSPSSGGAIARIAAKSSPTKATNTRTNSNRLDDLEDFSEDAEYSFVSTSRDVRSNTGGVQESEYSDVESGGSSGNLLLVKPSGPGLKQTSPTATNVAFRQNAHYMEHSRQSSSVSNNHSEIDEELEALFDDEYQQKTRSESRAATGRVSSPSSTASNSMSGSLSNVGLITNTKKNAPSSASSNSSIADELNNSIQALANMIRQPPTVVEPPKASPAPQPVVKTAPSPKPAPSILPRQAVLEMSIREEPSNLSDIMSSQDLTSVPALNIKTREKTYSFDKTHDELGNFHKESKSEIDDEKCVSQIAEDHVDPDSFDRRQEYFKTHGRDMGDVKPSTYKFHKPAPKLEISEVIALQNQKLQVADLELDSSFFEEEGTLTYLSTSRNMVSSNNIDAENADPLYNGNGDAIKGYRHAKWYSLHVGDDPFFTPVWHWFDRVENPGRRQFFLFILVGILAYIGNTWYYMHHHGNPLDNSYFVRTGDHTGITVSIFGALAVYNLYLISMKRTLRWSIWTTAFFVLTSPWLGICLLYPTVLAFQMLKLHKRRRIAKLEPKFGLANLSGMITMLAVPVLIVTWAVLYSPKPPLCDLCTEKGRWPF